MRVAALSAFVLALLLGARSARADATCIAAYEQTQTLRKDGKLLAAKVQAGICSRESCPALLTKDCSRWLAELDAAIPTVILDPRTPTGALRADARVKLDGARLTAKIDGKPLPVDPGAHTFAFEADGAAPAESAVVVKEGDRSLKVTVTLGAPTTTAASSAGDGAKSDRPIPIGVWLFGGATVVALGTSAFFAIDGLGKKSDLDTCKPRCAPSDVDAMSSSFTLADVALGAGVMAGVAAVYLFLTRPTAESSTSARAHAVPFATPLPGGGAAGLSASF